METYDQVANVYSAVFSDIRLRRFEWPWLRKLVKALAPEILLDIGCGNGYLSRALWRERRTIIAIDPSPGMLENARSLTAEQMHIDYRLGKAENLPCDDNSCDCVISFLSFRYMDWPNALSEIRRVLKPGGHFLLIDMFSNSGLKGRFSLQVRTILSSRIQQLFHPRFSTALRALHHDGNWRTLVQNNALRALPDARQAILEQFQICEERLLSQGRRARTVGLYCRKLGDDNAP